MCESSALQIDIADTNYVQSFILCVYICNLRNEIYGLVVVVARVFCIPTSRKHILKVEQSWPLNSAQTVPCIGTLLLS